MKAAQMPVEEAKAPRPTLLMIENRIQEIIEATADTLDLIDDEQEAQVFRDKMDELLTDLRGMEAEKIDAYGSFITRCEAEESRLKEIIDNLHERKKRVSNRIQRAKAHLLDTMFSAGVKKLEGTVFIARFTPSESVEVEEANIDRIPEEFVRIKKEPDKTAIKKAISGGADIPFARIKTNFNVTVKSK